MTPRPNASERQKPPAPRAGPPPCAPIFTAARPKPAPAARAGQNGHLPVCEYLAACAHDPMPSLDTLRAAASSAAAHAAAAAGGALGEMELMSDCQEIAADDTQLLLQDAFSSLSLHEKCALSMSLKGPGRAQTAHGFGPTCAPVVGVTSPTFRRSRWTNAM